MTKDTIIDILSQVKYRDWQFHVEERGENIYLQVRFSEQCLCTKQLSPQAGRKWILSKWMTKSEVVTTAFKAVMTAEEHEIREKFRYRGRMIFGPHFDIEALWEAAPRIEVRPDPRTIEVD